MVQTTAAIHPANRVYDVIDAKPPKQSCVPGSFKRTDSLPSPTPSPKPRVLLRRLKSTSSATRSALAAYAGPVPTRKDGSRLKSCFRNFSSSQSTDTASESYGSSSHKCHRVGFSHVAIREYSRECGDNPSVASGPPLALGWDFNQRSNLDIDSYEEDRASLGRGECRRLSADEREHILTNIGGHSHRRVLTAQFEARIDHQKRWETIDSLGGLGKARHIGPRERVLIMKESAARKLERAYKGTSSAKEQRKLWENARRASLDEEAFKEIQSRASMRDQGA